MARKCLITGKHRLSGNNVSHAKNRTKRVFNSNIQMKRIFVPELGKTVRVKLSTSALRTIDKLGFSTALRKAGLTLDQVLA